MEYTILILLLPLALILPRVGGLGAWGLLLAEPVSDFLASCTTCVLFLWRSKKLLPKQQSVWKRVEKLVHSGKNV